MNEGLEGLASSHSRRWRWWTRRRRLDRTRLIKEMSRSREQCHAKSVQFSSIDATPGRVCKVICDEYVCLSVCLAVQDDVDDAVEKNTGIFLIRPSR